MFNDEGQSPGLPIDLLEYRAGFFTEVQSEELLQQLIRETPWQQRTVKMYDKEVLRPRLTAWYGDPEVYDYTSLGNTVPLPWTPELFLSKTRLKQLRMKMIRWPGTVIMKKH